MSHLPYYGLRGLLVFHFINAWHCQDANALQIFAIFNALMYTMPVIAGFLSDKYFNAWSDLQLGWWTLLFGYSLLLLPSQISFNVGLLLAIWGHGFFKPNIAVVLKECYRDDPSLTEKFTYLFLYSNIGAIIAFIGCGWLAVSWSDEAAFVVILWSVCAGLLTSIRSMGFVPISKNTKWLALLIMVSLPLGYSLLNYAESLLTVVLIVLVSVLMYFAYISKKYPAHRQQVAWLFFFFCGIICFDTFYEQLFGSLNVFFNRYVDRNILGYTIPHTWLVALNPIFVVAFGVLISKSTDRLGGPLVQRAIWQTAMSFGLLSVCYIWLFRSTSLGDLVGIEWIIISTLYMTIAELLLLPISLTLFSTTAPPECQRTFVGIWWLSAGFGNFFAGYVAKKWIAERLCCLTKYDS